MKMKKTKILGLILALIIFFTNLPFGMGVIYAQTGDEDVEIIFDNFPDAKFREYINDNIDKDHSGSLSKAEREAVKEINVGRTDYNDTQYDNLVGLKYFPNLQKLNCFDNDMDELNLSENPELIYLDCSHNNLQNTLDLSKNKKLKTLICRNNRIETLNLENNVELEKLEFTNNSVKNIDLSKNTDLIELICENNHLESLDLSKNTKLKILNFKLNGIKNPDLSSNLDLSELNCQQNWNLGKLDLSSNKKLTKLDCFFCGLTELKLAENNELTSLNCDRNQLTELDLSTSPKLTYIECQVNKFKKLDLSKNLEIDDFNCSENQLTSLDLSKNNKLTKFTGHSQSYTVTLAPGAEYIKASDLPEGFDFNNVTGQVNFATVEADSFKLKANAKYIEYEYKTNNNDNKLGVKISINHYTKMIVLKNPDLIYTEGDKLDLSKLEVQLEDDEGNKIVVPYDKFKYYNIRTNIADKTELVRTEHNEQTIKIKLESLNAETNKLTVNERKFDSNNVVKIKVKTQPVKLAYTEGDKLNLAGLEVILIDKFGKEKDVALDKFNDYQITTEPANKTVLKTTHNATAITVKKGNLDPVVTNTITVTEKTFDPNNVKSMTIKEQPKKLEYIEGDYLALAGLEVILTDNSGKTKVVKFEKFDDYGINAEPVNATKLTVAGHNGKPVILTKGNLKPAKTENLTVKAKVFDSDHVASIKVTEQPNKLIYTAEEALDLDGLVVTLTDNQGTTKEVLFANFETNGLVATPANGTKLTVADHNGKTVKITKDNLTPAETYALTVNSKNFDLDNVVTIEILNQPSKISYTEGEKLNLAGLKVKLTDDKGNVKEVSFEKFDENGITTEPTNGKELTLSENGKKVTITKGNGSEETHALTVNPKVFDSQNITKIEVKAQPKLDYTEDDKLNLSKLVVTLTDNQGLKEDVAFEKFVDYGLTVTPANDTLLAVADNGNKIKITKENAFAETDPLSVKAKENPPTPTDPKIIGPVDPNAPGTTVPNPNEYWAVTFVSEDTNKGTVDAANTFYIPMSESKKLSDIKAPEVIANSGYVFEKWDLPKDTAINKNLTVKAIFKAKGNTPNPPTPQDPDQEARDYWIVRFLSDNPYRGYIVYGDTLRIEKNKVYRFEDLTRLAPEAIPYNGYEFAGWSPYLYGNQAIINGDIDIYARFEEIYVPRYSYERRRPRRIYDDRDDRDDRDDHKEEKPVEVNEYDKLEAILFINDSIMQKSVNGVVSQVRMDIAPFIYQARTMLPIRYVAESLGFMVTWDANTRTVYLVDKENIVQIPVDTNNIIVNGKAFVSDVKPMIKNNRTMLPVANVARALGLQDGKDILWDAAMKFVTLRRNVLK